MKKIVTLCYLLFLSPLLFATSTVSSFKEGTQYQNIKPTPPMDKGSDVQLVEFFWYGCPHCYHFEPVLKEWKEKNKPENVTFQSIPVIFPNNKTTILHAKMFYALTFMKEIDRIHPIIFKALHKDRINLRSLKKITSFLSNHNVDIDKFKKVINSFAVQSKVQRAGFLGQRYGIRGVPTLVLDQRYRSGKGLKNYQEMLKMMNYLNSKILSERQATATAKKAASLINQDYFKSPKAETTPYFVAGGMDLLNQMAGGMGGKTATDSETDSNADEGESGGGMIEQMKSKVINTSTSGAKALTKKAADKITTDNVIVNQVKDMAVDKAGDATKAVSKKTVDKAEEKARALLPF